MCLILLANEQHERYPFVFAANRDEFFERPAAPAAFWEDAPDVLAGRDLVGGGTWAGVTRTGRFAALTNYREPDRHDPGAPSRGALVADFLAGDEPPERYLRRLAAGADRYNGFNLVAGDFSDSLALFYFSNRDGAVRRVEPGVHGLSNHLLDTPWPKVRLGREALGRLLERPLDGDGFAPEPLFDLLADETRALDEALPDTGVGPEWERALSPAFIRIEGYGTRASTLILVDREGRVTFLERSFDGSDLPPRTRRFHFELVHR